MNNIWENYLRIKIKGPKSQDHGRRREMKLDFDLRKQRLFLGYNFHVSTCLPSQWWVRGIGVLRRNPTTKKDEMWGYPTTPLWWLQSNTQESVNQWEGLTEMTPLLGDVSWLMRCGGRVAVWTRTVESLDPVMIKPGLCHIEVIVPRGSWPKSKLWNFQR